MTEVKSIEEIKLPEMAIVEAGILLDRFKKKLAGICEDVMGDLYVNIIPYIESDSWCNFRNQVVSELQGYSKVKLASEYDFALIRKAILKHHRDDIIKDLNKDMLEEIEGLKKEIERLEGVRRWG